MTSVSQQPQSGTGSYRPWFQSAFSRAAGATLVDANGKRYIDFFSGAGILNYGHNHPSLTRPLPDAPAPDGVVRGLTAADPTRSLSDTFERLILQPRNLLYTTQVTGPTGDSAIDAAVQLAQRLTGRNTVVTFTHAAHRPGGGLEGDRLAPPTVLLPYDGDHGASVDTTDHLDRLLQDSRGGPDHPAAVIVETIQGEGGLNVASFHWLQALERICRRDGVLVIVDDLQAGCGRTGPFFSFEDAAFAPDIVALSEALCGGGFPLSLVLMKPELAEGLPRAHATCAADPGALAAAHNALEEFWQTDGLTLDVRRKCRLVRAWLQEIAVDDPVRGSSVRGRGLMQGLDCGAGELAGRICARAFESGLVIGTSGADGRVVKFMSPLTISESELSEGLDILKASAHRAFAEVARERREFAGTAN